MKKFFLLMVLFAALLPAARAQFCIPDTAGFTAGVYVLPATLPCITQGSAYSGTINIKVPDSVDAHYFDTIVPAGAYFLHVDSLIVDSITGMPSGILALTYPGASSWLYGGNFGCVRFTGTTASPSGNYPLAVYGRACVHGLIFTIPIDSCAGGNLSSFFSYNLSVCGSVVTGVCTPDTAAFTTGVHIYPATLPCITPGTAYSGQVSIRVPDSIDASAFYSSLPANTYFVYVDSVRIDSVTGAPAGITAAYNPSDSIWLHGNQFACALFSGTTHVAAGNFPINVYITGCVHGTFPIIGALDTCIEHGIGSFFNFSLNVCNGPACSVDTALFSPGQYVAPPTQPCIITGDPFAGQINMRVPDSLDASLFSTLIPAGNYYIHVDSIDIQSITGYPAGITSISNPVLGSWLYTGQYACAALSGTVNGAVTAAGVYPLTITGIGCGHGTFPVIGTIDTCMAVTFTHQFPYTLTVCFPAGITDLTEGLSVNIYPNPNQGNFMVSLSSEERLNGTLAVLDQLGRAISMQNLDMNGSRQVALNLGTIAPGAYLLVVNASGKRSVKQFMVK